MKVSIIGATGYGGLELFRLLKNHPVFEIVSVHTSSKPGSRIFEEAPHLMNEPFILEAIIPEKIAAEAEIVFLAAPSGVSGKIAEQFTGLGCRIIDLSGDLRLKDPETYAGWYKHTPVSQNILDEAVYGLAEWNKEQISKAQIIANPGCYPTAALLGLAPLFKEGAADGRDVIIDAKSGVSGAGKSVSAVSHYSTMNENFKVYKVHEHQHIPEIEQQLSIWQGGTGPVSFTTHLVPMTRGIMTTMYTKLHKPMTGSQLYELYQTAYEPSPFVRVRPPGSFPSTKEVYGSNYCDIGVAFDERTQKATIVSVIDNLVKGAAGQAVHNANIMTGLEETAGLLMVPLYP